MKTLAIGVLVLVIGCFSSQRAAAQWGNNWRSRQVVLLYSTPPLMPVPQRGESAGLFLSKSDLALRHTDWVMRHYSDRPPDIQNDPSVDADEPFPTRINSGWRWSENIWDGYNSSFFLRPPNLNDWYTYRASDAPFILSQLSQYYK